MACRRLLIIHNANAGAGLHRRLAAVTAALAARGVIVTIAETGDVADLDAVLAAHPGIDGVAAAGGDGTLRALAGAVVGSRRQLPIGVIPVGTANVMARELGLGFSPDAIAETLASGPAIPVQTGTANGELFLLMAGAGFDGEILRLISGTQKRHIGRAAFILPTLRTLSAPLPALTVQIDGRQHDAAFVVAARARRYGGPFTIARDADLRRPGLIAVLFKPRTHRQFLAQLLALAASRLEGTRGVTHVPCREITVPAPAGVATEIDGDLFQSTPLRVSATGPQIDLIVPGSYLRAT